MKLKTIVLSLVCAALFAPVLRAQDADTAFKRSLSIKFDARVDGKYDYFTKTSSDQFGFYGKYIFFQCRYIYPIIITDKIIIHADRRFQRHLLCDLLINLIDRFCLLCFLLHFGSLYPR